MLALLAACSATGLPLPAGDTPSLADSATNADDSGTDSAKPADSGGPDDSATDTGPTDSAPPDPCASTVTAGAVRGGSTPIVTHSEYDYAPAVLWDHGYKMWWCGGIAGDYVLYAEADSLDGPWHAHGSSAANTWDYALQPTGIAGDFDGAHTCDPSVVRAGSTWYLYYGGFPTDSGGTTRIGVASSTDGLSWTRLNGGAPIVNPVGDWTTAPSPYGAGQPSVVYKDGAFYLSYTDTTGGDVDGNAAGQFVLRSSDPTFQTGVEELTATGFVAQTAENRTQHALIHAFGVDWQYADALGEWAMAVHGVANETTIVFFDEALSASTAQIAIAGEWAEGPGIVSRPDKHSVPSAECGTVPLDVVHAVGPDIPAWELTHKGADVSTGLGCECVDEGAVWEGTLLESDGLPLTLVRDGQRLQFANLAPAGRLSHNNLVVTADQFAAVPYGASLYNGNDAIYSDGTPGAFVLDDGRIWPVSCPEILTENNSTLRYVDIATFGGYSVGPALNCLF